MKKKYYFSENANSLLPKELCALVSDAYGNFPARSQAQIPLPWRDPNDKTSTTWHSSWL
jgi:hypothetical protein